MPRFEKGSDEAKAYMKSIREGRKLTNNYEKMKGHENLIMTNSAKFAVPKTLLHIDGKGEQKIIKTVTKSGNLTRRDKKPVIEIEPHEDNTVRILKNGTTKTGRSKNLMQEINLGSYERYKRESDGLHEEYQKALKSKSKTSQEKAKKLSKLLTQVWDNTEIPNVDYGQSKKVNFKNERLHAPRSIESTKMKQITEKLDKLGKKKKETKT
jgi:hypothetical protein